MNIPKCPDKPFLTYDQQLDKLKEHNIIFQNEDLVIKILKSVPYYSLVNGTRKAFSSTNVGLQYICYTIE